MDSYTVYLCSKEMTHYLVVSDYGPLSDLLEKFSTASREQSIEVRHHRELRVPDVSTELIPKLLKPCDCGGRFVRQWGEFCRSCVTQGVFDSVGTAIQNGALSRDDFWVDDVIKQIKSLANTWEIDLEAE